MLVFDANAELRERFLPFIAKHTGVLLYHSLAVNALSLRASVGPTELPNVRTALAIASDQTPFLHACLLHRSRDAQGFSRIEVTESG